MEWSTELEGNITSFNKLDPDQQQEVASTLSANLEKIRAYAEANQNKSGIEKDYAQYLKAVAMSPDLNQIFVINKQPVLVHWGLICESDQHPGQGMYAGWDEFVSQIQKKAKAEPASEADSAATKPQQASTPAKPVKDKKSETENRPDQAEAAAEVFARPPEEKKTEQEKEAEPEKEPEPESEGNKPKEAEKKSEEQNKEEEETEAEQEEEAVDEEQEILACGLGRFRWVKWLAILLAIIILLLLILRLLPPSNRRGGMPGGGMGSGMGMPGGGAGGAGAGAGGGSGMPSGMGSGGKGGSNMPQMPVTCPQCGHKIDPKTGEHQTDQTMSQPDKAAPVAEKTGEPASKVASEPNSETQD
jgi:chemotaxis protein histidine kinase CheA